MGLLKKLAGKTIVGKALGLNDKKKRAAPVDPDPINPLTGRPISQNIQPGAAPQAFQGLGQMAPAFAPPPVSMAQGVPQGLGSDVFRSTLAPLQQANYGLGQIDPRFLTGSVQVPGGSNAGIGFTPGVFG